MQHGDINIDEFTTHKALMRTTLIETDLRDWWNLDAMRQVITG